MKGSQSPNPFCIDHRVLKSMILAPPKKTYAANQIVTWVDNSFQVRKMIGDGYLKLLTGNLNGLEGYWNQLLKDFPGHPAHGQESQSVPLTLYGTSLNNIRILFSARVMSEWIWGFSFGFPLICHLRPIDFP